MDGAAPFTLTEETFHQGLHALAERDRDLAVVLDMLGPPPLWARQPGFATLIHIILEQQVSLASAQAAFDRLREAAGSLTPQRFLALSDEELRSIGFSRQKATYSRHLAQAIVDGGLDLQNLARRTDDEVRTALVELKGIGPWTADIYLLMALRRPDIWPVGDLALVRAVQEVKSMDHPPDAAEMEEVAGPWRPWRAVASRLLWHHYLRKRNQ